jgi:anti-sigma regulatory factor (Ser/Thr protein kinase)
MGTGAASHFIFNNTAEELYPLTVVVVDLIKQQNDLAEAAVRKVKLVLMELLTNALKHNGGVQTYIQVSVSKDSVILTRADRGNAIAIISNGFRLEWPLPGRHHTGRVISFYGDDSGMLNGALKNNCHIRFFIEETGRDEINKLHLPEHFGLMIITRACSNFEYEFDIDTCTNKFTATIPLISAVF